MSNHRKGADSGEPFSEAQIDEALAESFPASDPPPWTLGVEPNYSVEEEKTNEGSDDESAEPNDSLSD